VLRFTTPFLRVVDHRAKKVPNFFAEGINVLDFFSLNILAGNRKVEPGLRFGILPVTISQLRSKM